MENLKLAGFGKRLVAYIIDAVVLGIAMSIVLIPFGGIMAMMGMGAAEGGEIGEAAMAATAGFSIMGIILIAIAAPIIYDGLMTASAKQGTLGKIAMKIKVIKEDGSKLSTSDAIIRAVVKSIVGGFCAFLWFVMLFNKQEQNLHDMAAKSLVVSAE